MPPKKGFETAPEAALPTTGTGRLRGRIAIVTGGGGGIGRAVGQLFLAEGASVMLADLASSDGKKVAEDLGPNAEFTPLDVRDPQQWKAVVDATVDRFGYPADILVSTAGLMITGASDTADPAEFQRAFDVNAMGALHGIQAVGPGMRQMKKGAIVLISSMAGATYAVPGMAPYSMSKAALSILARSAALDFSGSGVRVNSVVPGQIDTPMSRAAGVLAPDSPFWQKMPIQRTGYPRDIAQAVLYLASDESSWVTGTEILVDGGMEAGPVLA